MPIKMIQFDVTYSTQLNRSVVGFFMSVLMLSLILINPALADEYSDGFAAYIDGNYVQAEKYWLKAASKGDAKSMFNLGLLNEKSKLVSGSSAQAEKWYRKAADNGYSAANYHLAQRLLERGGSDDQVLTLIKIAADQGYAPAQRYIAGAVDLPKPVAAITKAEPAKRDNYLVETWINKQNRRYWTIQLLAFKQESKVQSFIDQHGLRPKAAYFIEKKDGVVWYKLIYGVFESKDKATFARQNLSSDLQEFGPWLRTIASVQAITK